MKGRRTGGTRSAAARHAGREHDALAAHRGAPARWVAHTYAPSWDPGHPPGRAGGPTAPCATVARRRCGRPRGGASETLWRPQQRRPFFEAPRLFLLTGNVPCAVPRGTSTVLPEAMSRVEVEGNGGLAPSPAAACHRIAAADGRIAHGTAASRGTDATDGVAAAHEVTSYNPTTD